MMRILLAITCLTMVSANGCIPRSFPVDWAERGRAAAQAEMQFVSEPTEADDEPETDVCPNCDGKGEVGDGRNARTCEVCDGTGKRTDAAQEPQSEPTGHAVIVMASRPDCAFCDQWWAVEKPKYVRQGWVVVERYAESGPVPRFTLMNGNRVLGEHVGYMPTSAARVIVSGESAVSHAEPVRVETAPIRNRGRPVFVGGSACSNVTGCR